MRLSDAIERADLMRPNNVPEPDKRQWLWIVETEYAEMMGIEPPEWEELEDPELLLPERFEQVYIYYLASHIDHWQEEINLYQIDAMMAQQLDATIRSWWIRHGEPRAKSFRIKGVWI